MQRMTGLRSRPGYNGDHDDGSGLGSVLLPPVVHEASAAILIVDLRRQSVVYANDLAHQLAPGQRLPIPVDRWSAAAGLEDVTGGDLPKGAATAESRGTPAESLLRIAQGEPVTGEAVTASRETVATASREVLWVLGLPLVGAPEPIASLALVVFVPARNARLIAGVQESAATMRDRAVLATRMSFTITDPNQPDDPLVWINPAFTETTGYSFDEAVGRNCRFLQGPDTDRAVVDEIRDSLRTGRSLTTTLLNYRQDGTTFWNELSVSPVRDDEGRITHFVGVQADVTARVEAQRARDAALSQVAAAADRLALLADFTARMAMSQHPDSILELLGDVLVPRVATACAIFSFDDTGRLRRPFMRHERQDVDPGIADTVRALRDLVPEELLSDGPVWRVLRGEERQVVIADYATAPAAVSGAAADERTGLAKALDLRSMVVLPLVARQGVLGAIVAADDSTRPGLDEGDIALVRDLAVRAGLMLENTQLYARERATAATLQRSLLPRLPDLPGVEIAASYVPAADEAAVGGDWYDVFPLRVHGGESGGVGVVVGDVMGHNYDSAARMGKLSTIVRAYGWPGSDPYTVLTAVDELIEGGNLDYMATCLYAKLTLHGHGATLNYSSAGHPPAIVRRPKGSAITLDGGRGPMIGISGMLAEGSTRPTDARIDLAAGSTLICFTDGLTDGFADEPDLDAGLAELVRLTDALPADAPPRVIVDTLTSSALRHNDDVAVVAIRIL
jgi:PAS domain S-box-containing protein